MFTETSSQAQVYREHYADPDISSLHDPMTTVGHAGQEEEKVINFTSTASFSFMVASSVQGTRERAALIDHVSDDYATEEVWE